MLGIRSGSRSRFGYSGPLPHPTGAATARFAELILPDFMVTWDSACATQTHLRGVWVPPPCSHPPHPLGHHLKVLLQGCRRLHSSNDSCSRSAALAPAGISKAQVKQRWHHQLFCPLDSLQAFLMPQQPLLLPLPRGHRSYSHLSPRPCSPFCHRGMDPLPLLCSHPCIQPSTFPIHTNPT